VAQVIVPDYQLSLAIGKEGQNARLAARLTGWRIDIRPDREPAGSPAGQVAPDPAGGISPGAGAGASPVAGRGAARPAGDTTAPPGDGAKLAGTAPGAADSPAL
jgi:N utilization substance protein A